jgi:hypothetical protein
MDMKGQLHTPHKQPHYPLDWELNSSRTASTVSLRLLTYPGSRVLTCL